MYEVPKQEKNIITIYYNIDPIYEKWGRWKWEGPNVL